MFCNSKPFFFFPFSEIKVLTLLEIWVEEDSLPSLHHLLVAVALAEEGEEERVISDLCRPPPSSSTAERLLQNGTLISKL